MTSLQPARTIPELLAQRARATPDTVAFRDETGPNLWQDVTWGDFARQVATLSQALRSAGLRRGDRLALLLPTSLQWEVFHHAALALGVAVVGLDAHDLPERLATMARQAQVAAFVVADEALWSRLSAAGATAPLVIVTTGADSSGESKPKFTSLDQMLESAATFPPLDASAAPEANDTATIIFTSGTTGAPKGIAYSHAQVTMAVGAIADAFDFVVPGSQLLCWLPLSNLFQRVVNLAGLRQGATTTMLGDPRRVMEVVAGVAPDVFVAVPRFYEKLHEGILARIQAQGALPRRLAGAAWDLGRRVSAKRRGGQEIPWALALAHSVADRLILSRIRQTMGPRLRCMVSGSAPLSSHLLAEFDALGWLVLEAYGLSENVMPMALNRLSAFRFGSVGRPLRENEIRVDEDGRILVRGPGVFDGYLGEAPGAQRNAQGWTQTGDLGTVDSDGFLHLSGRSNDIFKTSTGRRIAPAVAESVLKQVTGIDQVVLLGAGRKGPVALCTLNPGAERSDLVSRLRQQVLRINEAERPMAIALLNAPFTIESGELTPNLKLRRAAIEARHGALIDDLYAMAEAVQANGRSELPVHGL